ncbi:G-patch-domain Zn-finger DNA-binding protein [Mycena maculata]|uniref:G-patch-domain Zn-finger DNA-binding protein n=1 Tax=Mycena maculata TaxID=230809 RepID=A0AAD7KDL9_9AGAR|nr:G-patch-domain Zn-finger DNA-binding protein [Mycena maculata]
MDIDGKDPYKYDEYVAGPAQEVITVETKIKPSNKGFAMLAKLGWIEGQPLGLSDDGRVDPIPFQIKRDSTGLGKMSQDVRMIETTVSQRRGLDSERMTKETEDQRRAREDLVARRSALESEIFTTLKAFYCELCDKQFKTVVAYTEHTNSYAHHHKARFKDMQANVRIPQDDVDKRKEKERKREEKELRKIAAANGIKMAKPPATISAPAPADPVGASSASIDIDGVPLNPGWASGSGTRSAESQPGFKKSGWATVGSSTDAPAPLPEPVPPSGGWTPSPPVPSSSGHPAFRTAGWTSLDTGSSHSPPPPPPVTAPPAPPPASGPPPPPANVAAPPPRAGGWSTISPLEPNPWSAAPPLSSSVVPQPPPPAMPTGHSLPTSKAQAARSGWQQFQKSASSKRR